MNDSQDTNGAATDSLQLTTNFGVPVPDNQNSLTAGPRGPTLLADHYLIEKNAQFNRERVPERVVHAKGGGAFGFFEVTNDVTEFTKAAFLSRVGKRTEMLARFSSVAGERGYADTDRDPRGFALKFYTEEGNYDLVGNNTPVFFIRDAIKFPDFIHSQKRHPQTNLRDPNRMWDFWALSPESLHQVTYLMGDRGIPLGWQFMDGFGSHTYQWTNAEGKSVWVKFHFKTNLGVKNMTRQEAVRMAGEDPDFHLRSLFALIDGGDQASFDPFDVTKVWSHKDYPLIEVGRMVLNRNPENYFADIEQAAFEPSNVVPGVWFSPDKMLQGRIFAYADAHRYRIGTNYASLPVNLAKHAKVRNYMRDGAMRHDGNGGSTDNYEPNSFGGPVENRRFAEPTYPLTGKTGHFEQRSARSDDFVQAGDLYRLMKPAEKDRIVDQIVNHMKSVQRPIQLRAVRNFVKCDPGYGERLAKGLNLTELLTKPSTP
ncbi:MAG: catalase [Candidatus Cybelea sp.]